MWIGGGGAVSYPLQSFPAGIQDGGEAIGARPLYEGELGLLSARFLRGGRLHHARACHLSRPV